MRVLIATTSTGDTESIANGIRYVGGHDVSVYHYDSKHTQSLAHYKTNVDPLVRYATQHYDGLREALVDETPAGVSCSAELLAHAQHMQPDLILYISAWGATFSPTDETLLRMKDIAPLVHMIFDGADPPWWPILRECEKAGLFDLTVNIDGAHDWPGGSDWKDPSWKVERGITLLTPIAPDSFPETTLKFAERPFPIGYAGNLGGYMRKTVVERLQQEAVIGVRLRDKNAYGGYAEFLQHCRIVINVPFTGSGQRKHVKGRVIETALAKACLLEWDNPLLREWFTPRLEYEEYENPDNAIEMVRFLVPHIRRCEEIGQALYTRVRQEHDPAVFWEQVFDRVTFRKQASAAE